MIMKKIVSILIFTSILGLFVSCDDYIEPVNRLPADMTVHEASDKFSEIFSKAIYDYAAVREFVKMKSLEMFDNDYDVFYPFIKDERVIGDKTFRDILLEYCSNESLSKIETALPLLNIYVPDFSWFLENGFNAENWNVDSPEIAILSSVTDKVYGAGEFMGQLTSDMIPTSPVLVIKNNERLTAEVHTKNTGGTTYTFRSDVYDRTKNLLTKFEPEIHERELPVEQCDSYCASSKLHSCVIDAWNELGSVSSAAERDYVYYGMTKNNPSGMHNKRAKDLLLRFRIDPQSYVRIADADGDPVFSGVDGQIQKTNYTDAQILSKIWKDGQFEIEMDVVVAVKSGGVSTQKLIFDIAPSDIFQMTKISFKFWHKTWLTNKKWQYTFDLITINSKVQNLASKWYYPNVNTAVVPWDLYNDSNDILIYCREVDASTIIKETNSSTFKFSNNFSVEAGLDIKKISLGVSDSANLETSSSRSYEISYQIGSDDLGSVCLRYSDPVITNQRIADGVTQYELFSYSTGSLEMCVVPYVY